MPEHLQHDQARSQSAQHHAQQDGQRKQTPQMFALKHLVKPYLPPAPIGSSSDGDTGGAKFLFRRRINSMAHWSVPAPEPPGARSTVPVAGGTGPAFAPCPVGRVPV